MKQAQFVVPEGQIRHHMGNVHCGKSDEFVTEMMVEVCQRASLTESQTKRCVVYALKCHHDNQNLYHSVMTGRL